MEQQGQRSLRDHVIEIGVESPLRSRRDNERQSWTETRAAPQPQAHIPDIELTKRTGEATLDMIAQTAQVIKLAEDRGQALADRGHQLARRAIEELKAAEARIKFLEERVRLAEARAREAEDWLVRIHEAIHRNLSGVNEEGRPNSHSVSAA